MIRKGLINLAGDLNCDETIREELREAGIQIGHVNRMTDKEVPASLIGVLNGFVFVRGWRYWIITGDMPLAEADYIYNNYTDLMIRCEGDCGNPQPIMWAQPKDKDEYFAGLINQIEDNIITIDEAKELYEEYKKGQDLFIKSYSIDTMEGLKALANIIRDHNIISELYIEKA